MSDETKPNPSELTSSANLVVDFFLLAENQAGAIPSLRETIRQAVSGKPRRNIELDIEFLQENKYKSMADLIELMPEEVGIVFSAVLQAAEPEDDELEIVQATALDTETIQDVAGVLGVNPASIPAHGKAFLEYMARLTNHVGPLFEIQQVASSYVVQGLEFSSAPLSFLVEAQPAGSNLCVAYALRHISLAAGSPHEVGTITDLLPIAPDGFRRFVDADSAIQTLQIARPVPNSEGFIPIVSKMTEGRGAILMALGDDHAVAVLGSRQRKGGTLEFLVANSLPSYEVDGVTERVQGDKLVWAKATSLVEQCLRRSPPGSDPVTNIKFYAFD